GLPLLDLSALKPSAREEESRRIARGAARRPYDLERGPLLRAAHLHWGGSEHALVLGMHHIVSDGWSMSVLVRELGEAYRALTEASPRHLPELPVQYADYAA